MNKLFSVVLTLVSAVSIAQTDFNNYQTIQSQGELPDDFSISLQERLEKEMQIEYDMSAREKTYFVENKSVAIDNLLHSGLVLFGDPLTKYVEDVAAKVLVNTPELMSELTFFTLRSNATNAFVTGEGMVFVTIGLLSQIVSESDLAMVLSHEIAHFEENHILQSFENVVTIGKNRRIKFDEKIEQLSEYSKNHELEADELGIIRYLNAGYPRQNVKQVFDILMYSHLPIDELTITEEMLAGDLAYIPVEFFPKDNNPIKVDEDYDDSKSSHPNIKNRKENAQSILDKETSAGGDVAFKLGEDRFNDMRDIARFERVQNWLYANDYVNCLYEIAVLERQYPNNKHLELCKAQAWCGLSVYSAENELNECFQKPEKVEGESYTIHYVFNELQNEDVRVLALRNIVDIKRELPNNQEIIEMERIAVRQLLKKNAEWEDFSELTFEEAIEKVSTVSSADSSDNNSEKGIIDENSEEWKKLSKYEKIKLKEQATGTINSDTELKVKAEIDSTNFRFYALSDYVGNSDILKEETERFKTKEKEEEALEEELDQLSKREYRKRIKEEEAKELHLGLESIVFVEPLAAEYTNKGFDPVKSADLQLKFVEAIDKSAEQQGMNAAQLSKYKMSDLGTDGYNQRAALQRYINQFSNIESEDIFVADYEIINQITEQYNTENVVFSLIEHSFEPDLNYLTMFAFIYFPPAILFYIPAKLALAHNVNMSVLVFNAKKGAIETYTNYYFQIKPTKTAIELHMYDLLMQLSTPK